MSLKVKSNSILNGVERICNDADVVQTEKDVDLIAINPPLI
jgi:hypothetical protein